MWIPAIWRPKMQFTTVRSKEKDYDIYLKSEKMVHSQQKHEKKVSQLVGSGKTVPSYFEPDKHCCNYLEREKFTADRSMKKMFPSYLEVEKTGSQLFRA